MTGALAAAQAFGESVHLSNSDTVFDGKASPAAALARWVLASNGDILHVTSSGSTIHSNWIRPAVNTSNYEARATVNSGAVTGGSGTGSWLGLGTSRNWEAGINPGPGSAAANLKIEIRRVGTTTILATMNSLALTAESSS